MANTEQINKKNEVKKAGAEGESKTKEKSTIATDKTAGGSVYAARKRQDKRGKKGFGNRPERGQEEYEQQIIDIARVTRVMAGGKRMRFRACVGVGNRKGKVGVGIDKGADVTIAVTKAVNKAKREMIEVPIVNDTISHEIYQKLGAAKILLKPARKGKGVIAGGAVRIVLELLGIKNITSKILGTNNNINVAKATILALSNLKKVEKKKGIRGNDSKKNNAANDSRVIEKK